jgi:hypothetical protein
LFWLFFSFFHNQEQTPKKISTKTRLPTCQTNDCFKNRSNALARAVSLLILILIPSDLSRTAFSDV